MPSALAVLRFTSDRSITSLNTFDGVNIASRFESIGEPGGVTVYGTVFEQAKDRLPVSDRAQLRVYA